MSLVSETGGPRHRSTDPITSQVAAELADLPGSHALVVEVLAEHGPLAAFEIEQHTYGSASPSRVRTALVELERQGVTELVPGVYRKALRCQAQVWRLS